MRKILTNFSFVLSMMVLLAACSDKETETVLTADDLFTTREVTFEGLAGEQSHTIEFESPKTWTAAIHSLGAWLTSSTYSGDAGRASIVIRPKSDNFGTTAREATVDIYIDGYEAYTIKVYQKSASTGDIQVNGHIDSGVMNLVADETGLEFVDTLMVTSRKRWSLRAEAEDSDILSFETDGESRNGEETTVKVVVKAAYSKFETSAYEGRFYIYTDEGTAVPITVRAIAKVGIYDSEQPRQDETERVSFQLVDDVQAGHFMTEMYVESNVRWTLGDMPEWLETATDASTITNVTATGKIVNGCRHVTFHLKANQLSQEGKSGVVELKDMRGEVIKKVNITYAGVGSNYVATDLSFRSEDPFGNPWGFEAKASYIDKNNEADYWKEIAHGFAVTTSTSFSSMADAPFHLLLVRGDGGIPRKQQVYWASLEMGSGEETKTGNLYTRNIAIRVNDRGDADDNDGVTDATLWRYAFVYIVPLNVTFNDLWEGDELKTQYANNMTLMAQKNDPAANYTFGFDQVKDGGTLTVPANGGAITLNVTPGSYAKCGISIQMEDQNGNWVHVGTDVCSMDYNVMNDGLTTVTFTLSENKKVTNPFTHQTTGAPRHIRITINAFIGDNEGSKDIFMFYIDQALNE